MRYQQTLPILVLILLSACTFSEGAPTETPPKPEPSNYPTLQAQITPQRLATPTPETTAMPIPTYSLDQAYQQIASWVDDNGSCRLPCIWGLIPGEADRKEIEKLNSKFEGKYLSDEVLIKVTNYDDLGGITLITWDTEFQTTTHMSYYFHEYDTLRLVEFDARSYQVFGTGVEKRLEYLFGHEPLLEFVDDYMMSTLISEYGSPSSILIAPYFNERPELPDPSWIWFSVVLIYEDQGFLAEYIMPRRMIGDSFAACVNQNTEIWIIAWDPGQSVPLTESLSVKSGMGFKRSFIDYFMPLEEATTMTIAGFTEVFQDPKTDACIYTPMELWPNP